MTEQGDDPELAAQRLEAALERIARRTAEPVPGIPAQGIPAQGIPAQGIPMPGGPVPGGPVPGGPVPGTEMTAGFPPDLVTGLDALIENLRAALGKPQGDRPD